MAAIAPVTINNVIHISGDDPNRIHYYVEQVGGGMRHLCVMRGNPLFDVLEEHYCQAHPEYRQIA